LEYFCCPITVIITIIFFYRRYNYYSNTQTLSCDRLIAYTDIYISIKYIILYTISLSYKSDLSGINLYVITCKDSDRRIWREDRLSHGSHRYPPPVTRCTQLSSNPLSMIWIYRSLVSNHVFLPCKCVITSCTLPQFFLTKRVRYFFMTLMYVQHTPMTQKQTGYYFSPSTLL